MAASSSEMVAIGSIDAVVIHPASASHTTYLKEPPTMESQNQEITTWSTIAYRAGVAIAMQPVTYAKTLIQMGHEPMAPFPTRTWLGKRALGLPGVFQYICVIKERDGILGCYRGVGSQICSAVITTMTYQQVFDSFPLFCSGPARKSKSGKEEGDGEEDEEEAEETLEQFTWNLVRHSLSRSAALVASQPFHVIAVRMMAQFVGRETKYTGLVASAREIYDESGLSGFFRGLTPRLSGEMLCILLASSVGYVVNTYAVRDRRSHGFVSAVASFVASTLTYPFHVVSTCMAVSGSSLAAGRPPHMPVYVDWTDCWAHLSRDHQLKRGSSLLWRYYTGPASRTQLLSSYSIGQFAPPSASL